MKKVNNESYIFLNNGIIFKKALLFLICIMVLSTQTGCRRGAGKEPVHDRGDEREYYSESSHEKREVSHYEESEGLEHIVAAGQSLTAIKNIYGISIQAIKAHNSDVSENKVLKIGQKIFIPGSPQVLAARRDSYFKFKDKPDKNSGENSSAVVDGGIPVKLNWPAAGSVMSKFSPSSKGIYIKIAPGASVKSTGAGEVVYSGQMKGYGNLIIVDHLNGLFSIYGMNAKNLVNKGAAVKAGSKLAIGGDKITDGYCRLYFELRKINSKTGEPESVDPLKYLK